MAACLAMWLYLKHLSTPIDRRCKSRNLGVASLKREFGKDRTSSTLETMHIARKHAYSDKQDRIMLERKMVKICLQTMLTMDLNNNNNNIG
jgi:hypothetical protein